MHQLFQSALQLHRQGHLAQAEAIYQQILRKFPNQADTLNALGMLLQQRGLISDAISNFRKALQADRHATHVYLNLGEALRVSGLLDDAWETIQKALKLKPSYPEAWYCLANILHDQNKPKEAIQYYKRVIQSAPQFTLARNSLGVALQETGQLKEAIIELQEAIRLQPEHSDTHLNLANTYYKNDEKDLAKKHYIACLSLSPHTPQAHLGLAQLKLDSLIVSEEIDKEIESHLKYAESLSNTAEFLSILGIFYGRKGKWEMSFELLRKSIQLRPEPNTIYQFVNGYKFTEDDIELSLLIESLIKDNKFDSEGKAMLFFARGKMLNDLQEYSSAFKFYDEGNKIINASINYDPASIEGRVTRLIKGFSPIVLEKQSSVPSNKSEKLVFLVGMPRSGTTLTEQVIASHQAVLGAGELFGMVALEESLPKILNSNLPYPELIQNISHMDLEKISNNYLDELENLFKGNYLRLTDKFPLNFWRVGLIAMLFPKAKIINVKRDPIDCCLSNYFQKYVDEHDFAYNLQNLAHYYRSYQKLMNHWHKVLPGRIFDLQYEDLTADPEYWSRKLIDHIGLEWDEACLKPHGLNRSVRTASYWQVRQPIYKSSVKRWRNYEQEIQPLLECFGN
jgi:tetratricopeptide (TPR) repeat protein